jgi:hypothetical protein
LRSSAVERFGLTTPLSLRSSKSISFSHERCPETADLTGLKF